MIVSLLLLKLYHNMRERERERDGQTDRIIVITTLCRVDSWHTVKISRLAEKPRLALNSYSRLQYYPLFQTACTVNIFVVFLIAGNI